jgi:predicted TIM-barrel fold metal-dependent hydrolase
MIIDAHVHPMLRIGDAACFEVEEAKLLDCMDRAGIGKANAIPIATTDRGFASYTNVEAIEYMASFLAGILAKNPTRFYGMLWLNPYLSMDILSDIVRRHILEGPVHGVKILYEMKVSDPKIEPLAAFLEKHDVPVLIHAWYNNFQAYAECEPSDVACLAEKFPGLRILMAHLRGSRFRGAQDIKKHRNVMIDTCGSESEDGYLDYALRELGPDRVVYGSDYPGRDFSTSIGRIESLEMPAEVREKVFCRNAAGFLEGGRS